MAGTADTPRTAPADMLDGLQGPGRAFLEGMIAEYRTSLVQRTLLREAAFCVDALAIWRPLATTDKGAARLVAVFTRTLASLLSQAQTQP